MKNSDPIFWPDTQTDLNIRQQINKNYADSINILQTQWYQADLDQRFVMGDQDLWGLLFPGVPAYRSKRFNFNLTNRNIQMVSGYERRNRKSLISIPILAPAQKTADQLTKCLFHINNKGGAHQVYSDAFEMGALTQGLGFISMYANYTTDPVSPDIGVRYIDMKSCLFDAFFRKHDMSDCRFFETRQFFGRDEAATIYSQWEDEIMALPSGTYRDDKFYYMPEVYQIQFPNLIALDEYWYLSSRKATFLVDKQTEETQEWYRDEEELRDLFRARPDLKQSLAVVKQSKPTVRRTILLNDRVLVDEANPYGLDKYPIVPCLGYFNPDTPYYAFKFRGIARDMRDAQYLFNQMKVNDLDQVYAQQQGLKIKKGALVTPDDSLNQGNGRVLVIDPAFQMTDVEKMDIHPPAPTLLQMEEMLKQTMMDISGINEELLGSAVDDKAGILSMLRQGAGLTTLQKLFDQFDECMRLCGDIQIQMVQNLWTYGKVQQVIGEEPVPEFDDKLFFKYGCKVVPGVNTESQQQLEAQQLIYLRSELGIPVRSRRILDKLTVQDKDELIEEIEQDEQMQQQQQQQMAQLQMQQMQVDNETKLSYARSQDGLAKERVAKIQLDKAVNVERIAKSKEDRTQSMLNVVKAIKELQGIDIDLVEKALNIIERTQSQEPQNAQQEATV